MERWRHDLYVLWACTFVVQLGFSMIMPFLPLYLGDLGVRGPHTEWWTGVIFSASYVVMALVSPLWGALADRHGRKPMMLRSAFGMAAVVWAMGLVTSPWQLLGLRLLQGATAGFISATPSYLASVVPTERSGYALGLLSTGSMAGSILGPLVGGLLAQVVGYRPIFALTSVACLAAGIVVWLRIQERFTPPQRPTDAPSGGTRALLRDHPAVFTLALTFFFTMFSLQTAEPVLARYLQELAVPERWLPLLAGLAFSATGVATLLVAPLVGTWSDQGGGKRMLLLCLGGAALLYLAQGFATQAWQLVALRFALGLCTGGILPVANSLVARTVPADRQGRAFGVTNAALFLGNTVGPLAGGALAAGVGLRATFPITGAFLLLDLLWVWLALGQPAALVRTKAAHPQKSRALSRS